MDRHPGLKDPADIEPQWTPVKVKDVTAKILDDDPERVDVTLWLESGNVDAEWEQLFHALPKEQTFSAHLMSTGHRAYISVRVRNEHIERGVTDLKKEIAALNATFEHRILPERRAQFEARQSAKADKATRQAELNERMKKLNGGEEGA
ncbi:hypothetical protein [Rhodococcus jostii]|uniref:hypothetical protein n=1 Tax=Rhodococcus jostii TaxID=132919 RepID=UPI00363BEA14